MESLELKESLLALDPGVSPGFWGLRNEHLTCLAEVWEGDDMALLESFGVSYLNGELPPWFYKVWGSVSTTPLFKNSKRDSVRPLGVKSSLIRSFHKESVAKQGVTD